MATPSICLYRQPLYRKNLLLAKRNMFIHQWFMGIIIEKNIISNNINGFIKEYISKRRQGIKTNQFAIKLGSELGKLRLITNFTTKMEILDSD